MIAAAKQLDDLSTDKLLHRCRAGEQKAWDALIERYGRLVYSIPRRYGLSQADADDVFQSVFTGLHRQLGNLKDPKRLPSWLVTTTRRECWRLHQGRIPMTDVPDRIADARESAGDEASRWEQQHMVHEALGRLSAPERQLITALFLDSTSPSYSSVAARLGRKEGGIGPTRARVFKKLERILIAMGIDSHLDADRARAVSKPALDRAA